MNFQVSTSSLQILSWGQARVCEWRHATWKLYHSIHLCNPLWHYSFWKLGSTQLVGRWLCQISLLQVGTVSIRSRALINSCNVISVFLEKYWDISNLVFFWDFIEKMDLTHFAFCTQPPTNWVNRTQLISLAVNLVFFFFFFHLSHLCLPAQTKINYNGPIQKQCTYNHIIAKNPTIWGNPKPILSRLVWEEGRLMQVLWVICVKPMVVLFNRRSGFPN